jgi:methionyl-tRNA formyltransferase
MIYGTRAFEISRRAVIADLLSACETACIDLVRTVLPAILAGTAIPQAQTGTPSYGLQRRPEDGLIDWRADAVAIDRLIRAVGRPYAGAFTYLDGTPLYLWRASLPDITITVHGKPGQIARIAEIAHPCIVTGSGLLVIDEATDRDGANVMERLMRAGHQHFTDGRT